MLQTLFIGNAIKMPLTGMFTLGVKYFVLTNQTVQSSCFHLNTYNFNMRIDIQSLFFPSFSAKEQVALRCQ